MVEVPFAPREGDYIRHKKTGIVVRFERSYKVGKRHYCGGTVVNAGDSKGVLLGSPFDDRFEMWEQV